MSDPKKLRENRESDGAAGEWDEFPFHEELDEFVGHLRGHLFEGLRDRQLSIAADDEVVQMLAWLTSDFAGQVRRLAPETENWQQLLQRIKIPESVGDCLAAIQTETGATRLHEHLTQLPFPHFEVSPDDPNILIRISQDGTRTIGRFVDREFKPAG